jgi:UDP-N-acetylglucosamine 4,6-dehydratase
VALGEVQPWEVVQTNAHGTWNVVQAANEFDVTMVLLSTDKAVMPVNLYGATKMCAERITLTGGQRVVRYGNVIGSRGSVLHIFKQQAANGHVFSITDKRMTRFVINFAQAIWQVEKALRAAPGSITIPVLPAIRIVDLALAFDGQAEFREIGVQPGEKIHEVLSVDPWRCSEDADKLSVGEIKELIDATV